MAKEKDKDDEIDKCVNDVLQFCGKLYRFPELYGQLIEILQSFRPERNPLERFKQIGDLLQFDCSLRNEFFALLPEYLVKQFLEEDMQVSCNGQEVVNDCSSLSSDALNEPGCSSLPLSDVTAPSDQSSLNAANLEEQCLVSIVVGSDFVDVRKQTDGSVQAVTNNKRRLISTDSVQAGEPSVKLKKGSRTLRSDGSIAPVSKLGSMAEFLLFDKVRQAVQHQDVYENFLRCIALFNSNTIKRAELCVLLRTFLGRHPELLRSFEQLLGIGGTTCSDLVPEQRSVTDEQGQETDNLTYNSWGPSYRRISPSSTLPASSARTPLCHEVLNNVLVSIPSWSEDSPGNLPMKNEFEDFVYRCEDERFELEIVIESNASAITVLEELQKKLATRAFSGAEFAQMELDESLDTSEILFRRALQRVYGEKVADIMSGLKRNPGVAVPLVLRRLKARDEEWRASQSHYNQLWREQMDKYYVKSLDYQCSDIKQNDLKLLRSKALINEIETHVSECQQDGLLPVLRAHMTCRYASGDVMQEAVELVGVCLRRQGNVLSEDKDRIRALLTSLTHHFWHISPAPHLDTGSGGEHQTRSRRRSTDAADKPTSTKVGASSLLYGNDNWYLFLRLHHILCERLHKIRTIVEQHLPATAGEKESAEMYARFADSLRQLLDGKIETAAYDSLMQVTFTIHAYLTLTVDKILQSIVRQLHHLVMDEECEELTALWRDSVSGEGKCVTPAAYRREARLLLADERCYKMSYSNSRLSVWLLTEADVTEDCYAQLALTEQVSAFLSPADGALVNKVSAVPVFLHRNIRRSQSWMRRRQRRRRSHTLTSDGVPVTGVTEGEETDDVLALRNVTLHDGLHLRFHGNSLRPQYIEGFEDYMYRRNALKRARKIHQGLCSRQYKRYSQWLGERIHGNSEAECVRWLVGEERGRGATSRTVIIACNSPTKAPYRAYKRYQHQAN